MRRRSVATSLYRGCLCFACPTAVLCSSKVKNSVCVERCAAT